MVASRQKQGEEEKKKKRTREASAAKVVCKSSEDIEDFGREEVEKIRKSLLRWYYENQRVLPWRINQDDEEVGQGAEELEARAYAVWVSEVMLQQTRVATVIDYYNRWMEKWPTVSDLALASQEGAKSIVGGEFPTTTSALRKVQGIGDYTAGAIASIAFKEAVPVVDGNVIRVIARLKAISANPKESGTIKSFWKLAGQLVDPCRPGDFNQALMELGSTICNPTNPGCSTCPISDQCNALFISGNCKSRKVTDYPMKVAKVKQRNDFAAVCVVQITVNKDPEFHKKSNENDVFIIVKRPAEGLLAGLWEFPSVLLDAEEVDARARRKAMNKYLKTSFQLDVEENSSVILREDVGEYVHIFSHIRLKMYVELLILYLKGGVNALNDEREGNLLAWKCVDAVSMESIGLTSGVRKFSRGAIM
ncbi:hypothetical protein ACLOJK_009361 [Asimina triloba]